MAEGFKIADGYLKVTARTTAADREVDTFVARTDRKLAKAGDDDGKKFGKKFLSGLRVSLVRASGMLQDLVRKLVSATWQMTKWTLIIGTVATAIGGLAGGIVKLMPPLTELTHTLIVASGSLLLLPGAVAGLISIFAVAKVAVSGLGAAFKAAATNDTKKLAEAMKGLSPPARALVVEYQRLRPALAGLKLSTQAAMFGGVAMAIRAMASKLLPTLNAGMVQLGKTMSGTIRAALSYFSQEASRAALAHIFSEASVTLQHFTAALRPTLSILRNVTVVGAIAFSNLTEGIGNTVGRWSQSISQMASDGRLYGAIMSSVDALKALGGLIMDIGGIIKGVFGAAGPGQGMFSFFDRLNTLVNSVSGQAALSDLFGSLATAATALAPTMGVLLRALVPVAAALSTVAIALSPGLSDLITGLAAGISALAPGVAAFAPVLSTVGKILPVVGKGLSDLLKAASPGVNAAIQAIGEALMVIAGQAGPLGETLGTLVAVAAPALIPLAQALTSMIVKLGPALPVVFGAIVESLVAIAPSIPTVADAFSQLLVALAPFVAELGPLLAQILVEVSQELIANLNTLKPIIPVILQLTTVMLPWIGYLARALLIIAAWPIKLVALAEHIVKWLISPVEDASGAIVTFGAAVSGTFQKVTGWFGNLGTKIKTAVGDLGSLLLDAGKNVIAGFLRGIQDSFGAVKSTLGNLTSMLPDWKGPPDVDRAILRPAGRNVMAGFEAGLASYAPRIQAMLSGFTANIPAMAAAGTQSVTWSGDVHVRADFGNGVSQAVRATIERSPTLIAAAASEGRRLRTYRGTGRNA